MTVGIVDRFIRCSQSIHRLVDRFSAYNITIVTPSSVLPTLSAPRPDKPFFSVLIVNWNSAEHLNECLDALVYQIYLDFEVLLLDNGSDQPLPIDLTETFSALDLTVVRSDKNLGFAGGNNLLARSSTAKYLVLLNTDAFPEPDWLETLHSATQRYPHSFFASRLVSASDPTTLDGEWNVYHASGLAWRHNHAKSILHATPNERPVFSACAAAGAYPREAFDAIEGFDEDFFAYMEDIDLDFRLQLAGYPCVYLPNAVVRHVGAGSTFSRSGFMLRHGHRNLIWTFVKNMPGAFFWLLLPCHILANLIYIVLSFLMKDGAELRQGKREALQGLAKVWEKRHRIQYDRKVSAWSIARKIDWNPFSPLVKMTYQ